ncbi:MAG TPA: cupin domain-containing protein, partial [Thermopetrobacter sp.]|nr:cupin domain-containing protein [Thermopetrobacter sp.]
FMDLGGGATLFRRTCQRFQRARLQPPVVLIPAAQTGHVREELRNLGLLGRARIVAEPQPRGTAVSALAAALLIAEQDPRGLMLLTPSDHVVADKAAFLSAVVAAVPAARAGHVALFGIEPTRAEAEYGYIGVDPARRDSDPPWPVTHFVEKPPREAAANLVESGEYFWNVGLVLSRADILLTAARHLAPNLLNNTRRAIATARRDGIIVRPAVPPWQAAGPASLERAFVERMEGLRCVPLNCGWEDLGSWPALYRRLPHNEKGNAVVGESLLEEVRDSLVWNAGGPLLAMAGLRDVVAVSTPDAVLLCDMERADAAVRFARRLSRAGRPEALTPSTISSPWGNVRNIERGEGYFLRLLTLRPEVTLALPTNRRRDELWVVLDGKVHAELGEEPPRLLTAGESIVVPRGLTRRLENVGTDEARVLEVQLDARIPSVSAGQGRESEAPPTPGRLRSGG